MSTVAIWAALTAALFNPFARSPVQAPPVQGPPVYAPPGPAPLVQAHPGWNPRVAAQPGDGRRACLSASETRESVSVHQLREPMALLREAAIQARAEPLGARLCRWSDQFVYEMSLLRRDGRVVRVFVDAASGARVNAREKQER
jgi:hypothetical protein